MFQISLMQNHGNDAHLYGKYCTKRERKKRERKESNTKKRKREKRKRKNYSLFFVLLSFLNACIKLQSDVFMHFLFFIFFYFFSDVQIFKKTVRVKVGVFVKTKCACKDGI